MARVSDDMYSMAAEGYICSLLIIMKCAGVTRRSRSELGVEICAMCTELVCSSQSGTESGKEGYVLVLSSYDLPDQVKIAGLQNGACWHAQSADACTAWQNVKSRSAWREPKLFSTHLQIESQSAIHK
jgi:hypothetical protein